MSGENDRESIAMEKLSKLMALFVVKGLSEMDSVVMLSTCGFSNNEIASLLGKEPVTVRGYLHRRKKSPGKKRKSKV